jgi:hypothetical protein
MKRILQIMQACDGWEAVFFSYDDGELFCETVICWALGVTNFFQTGQKCPCLRRGFGRQADAMEDMIIC